jgi:hypothetical protein
MIKAYSWEACEVCNSQVGCGRGKPWRQAKAGAPGKQGAGGPDSIMIQEAGSSRIRPQTSVYP